MSAYPPPTENFPIFDDSAFKAVINAPLTEAQADKLYLKFPNAQGEETFQSIRVEGETFFQGTSNTFDVIPTCPTAVVGTNTTAIATTAFVLANQGGAGVYAPIDSPTFTGIPAAPTAVVGTNTTQLATTFVLANQSGAGVYAPLLNPVFTQNIQVNSDIKAYGGLNNYSGTGTYLWNANNTQYTSITQAVGGLNFVGAANGTTTMGDGVHLMNLNVPFGSITCSTPPAGTNSTIVATTAFVNNASGYSGQIPIQWAGSQQNTNSSYDLIYYGQATTGSLNTLYGIPITANSSNCIITATVSNSVCGATLMSGVQYVQFVYGSTMGSQVNNPNNNYPQITFNYDVAVHQQITTGISMPSGYINYTVKYIG